MTEILRLRDGQPLPEGKVLGPNKILAIERVPDGGPTTSWHYEYVVEVVDAVTEQDAAVETLRASDGCRCEACIRIRSRLAEQEKQQYGKDIDGTEPSKAVPE